MNPRTPVFSVACVAVLASGCSEPVGEPTSPSVQADPVEFTAGADPRFVDVAGEAGLDAVTYCGGVDKDHILESTGTGAAFLDFDGDGRLDIYLVNAWALDEDPSGVRVRGRNVLYRNLGDGTFGDVTESAGVGDDAWGCGVCVGDYDNNGATDLYVTAFGSNLLYRNRGDGTFAEVGADAGVDDAGWGAGASFFDADGDGDLDLYVANYIESTMDEVLAASRTNRWRDTASTMIGPFGLRGGRDRFYRNRGDGTFEEATEAAGLTDVAEGYGLGVVASDLDLDGDIDIYVANDSNPNYLYRNEGDGTFRDVGAWCGAGFSRGGAAQAGMGVDVADVDGDGLPEIIVTHFARDYCALYHNLGGLYFEDRTGDHEIEVATMSSLSWGCVFFDADLDADVDLFIVNGHIYPQVDDYPELNESYGQRPLLFRNESGRFVDISTLAGPGLERAPCGRGLAAGDYDDDGDLDLLVTGIDAPPVLLRNDTPRNGHWIKVSVRNRFGSEAIGARATVQIEDRVQTREVRSGSTYQSQNATDLHFGLGPHETIERLEITWPDGRTIVQEDVEVDRTIVVRPPA